MAETEKYRVTRHHIGDKDYSPGDTREAEPAVVAHLVERGVLVPANKADAPAKNKADPKPANKADA